MNGFVIIMNHPFHQLIGNVIENEFNKDYIKVIKDLACDGKQNVPLFCIDVKKSSNEYCDADIIIVNENTIRVIIEIEESNKKPNHICGKLLSSALCTHYLHENKNTHKTEKFSMADNVIFIQILESSKVKENSPKRAQWLNLEKSLQASFL